MESQPQNPEFKINPENFHTHMGVKPFLKNAFCKHLSSVQS